MFGVIHLNECSSNMDEDKTANVSMSSTNSAIIQIPSDGCEYDQKLGSSCPKESSSTTSLKPNVKPDEMCEPQPRHYLRDENQADTFLVGSLDENDMTFTNHQRLSNIDDNIGQVLMYFCKKCKLLSSSLGQLRSHIREDMCEVSKCNAKLITNNEDHSYANIVSQDGVGQTMSSEIVLDVEEAQQLPKLSTEEEDIVEEVSVYLCPICPYTEIFSEEELTIHAECHTSAGFNNLFLCHLCNVDKFRRGRPLGYTADWEKVKMHLAKVHRIDFNLTCSGCDYKCKTHEELLKHARLHNEICDLCSYSTRHSKELRVHESCHVSDTEFKCPFDKSCGSVLHSSWMKMFRHLVEKHPGTMHPNYHCQACGKGFHQLSVYEQHYKKCMLYTQCVDCEQLVSVNTVREHISQHSEEDKDQLDPKMEEPEMQVYDSTDLICHRHLVQFTCPDEMEAHYVTEHGRSFYNRRRYTDTEQHEHTTQHPIETDIAEAVVDNRDIIETDTKDFGDDIGESIKQCDTTEDVADSMDPTDDDVHFKTEKEETSQDDNKVMDETCEDMETGNPESDEPKVNKTNPRPKGVKLTEKNIKCNICYKKFATEEKLGVHCKRVHTEEKMKWLECGHCGKFFKNQVQRRNHVRTVHEKIKRKPKNPQAPPIYYQCSTCDFTSRAKCRVTNHYLFVHQGIYPFKCKYCNYKTKERSDMYRHQLRHLGVKRHACPYCDYKCIERWVMVNHCLKQHNYQLPKLQRGRVPKDQMASETLLASNETTVTAIEPSTSTEELLTQAAMEADTQTGIYDMQSLINEEQNELTMDAGAQQSVVILESSVEPIIHVLPMESTMESDLVPLVGIATHPLSMDHDVLIKETVEQSEDVVVGNLPELDMDNLPDGGVEVIIDGQKQLIYIERISEDHGVQYVDENMVQYVEDVGVIHDVNEDVNTTFV